MRVCLLVVIGAFILIGCQQAVDNTVESNNVAFENLSPTLETQSGYPAYPASNAYPGNNSTYPENVIFSTPQPVIDPSLPVPTPQPGNATLIGFVNSQVTGSPVQNVPVSLAKVYRNDQGDGAFALEGASSPTTITDGNGRFVFIDLEPSDYVIVVGNVEVNWYEIIPEPSGKVKVWTVSPEQVNDIGTIQVGLE